MASSKLLNLGNVRKVQENLRSIVNQEAIDAIEAEIEENCNKLYALGLEHYRFAKKLPSRHWRQKVSRLYYSSYAASRAVRLYVSGEHSTDVKDHQKIGSLPDDFPERARFSNKLSILRSDRNTCDYDHDSHATSLVTPTSEAIQLAKDFLDETRKYLKARGLAVRGKP